MAVLALVIFMVTFSGLGHVYCCVSSKPHFSEPNPTPAEPILSVWFEDEANFHTFSGYDGAFPKMRVSKVGLQIPTGSPTNMCAAFFKTPGPSGDPIIRVSLSTQEAAGLSTVRCFKVYNQTCDSLIPTTTTTAQPDYNEES